MAQGSGFESFFAVLDQIDASDSYGLREKLHKRCENPPAQLVAHCLRLESLSTAEVRQLLFAPTSYHMGLYERLLLGDAAAPGDLNLPANKVQHMALAHMYLVHCKCWERMAPFIAAGGLRQLVALLTHPEPILCSQALHVLVYATHPDMHDWNPSGDKAAAASAEHLQHSSQHDSRSTAVAHPAAGPDGDLWRELLQLQSGPLFTSLLKLSPDVWPGSGFVALQFMAFYLTWLRRWWCKDGVLQLSTDLLAGLAAWSTRASSLPEEREMAAALLADFGSAGPAPPVRQPAVASSVAEEDPAGGSSASEGELRVVADRTLVNSKHGSEAERLEAAGSDAFKAKDWATAIRLYSAALDVPVPHEVLVDEAPRRANYHANRAAAYLERCKELQTSATKAAAAAACSSSGGGSSSSNGGSGGSSGGGSSSGGGVSSGAGLDSSITWCEVGGVLDGLLLDGSSPETRTQLLRAAVMDCKAALDLAPTHAKARFRLATALRAQGSLKAAQVSARSAAQFAVCQADRVAAAHLDAAITKQLMKQSAKQEQAQQELQAQAAASSPSSVGHEPAEVGHHQQQQQLPGRPQSQGNPVDQLLQQFAAIIKQQATGTDAQQQQAADRAPGSSRQQPGVLLPSAAKHDDSGEQGSQVVMPGTASSGPRTSCRQGHPGKPLIQELASSPDDVTRVADSETRHGTSEQPLRQQERVRPCLEQLLDVLD